MYSFLGFNETVEASQILKVLGNEELSAKPYLRIEVNVKSFQLYHSLFTENASAEQESNPNKNIIPVAVIDRPIDGEDLANLLLNALLHYFITDK